MATRLVAAGNRELGRVLKAQKQLAPPAQRTADPVKERSAQLVSGALTFASCAMSALRICCDVDYPVDRLKAGSSGQSLSRYFSILFAG
ncbi:MULTISPECIES: hypothetical protein [Paraburkholderia]|uniref:hypothetical protein n=1 Tax=Paraburkholderia TaxID=1822464 RepID=UPI0038BDD6F9